jgi:hypothetical protein
MQSASRIAGVTITWHAQIMVLTGVGRYFARTARKDNIHQLQRSENDKGKVSSASAG